MVLNNLEIVSILKQIKEDSKRRNAALENFAVYEGELNEKVASQIKKKYPKTYEDYTVADYNLVKKITNKRAKAYKKAPSRSLSTDAETDRYNKLLEAFEFDDAMKLIDRYHNQYRYCALGVIRKKINDKSVYSFWALQPFEFSVIRNSDGDIICWAIPNGKDGELDSWTLWTDESHLKLVTKDYKDYIVIKNEGNPEHKNPFGVMPFVYIPMDISGRYHLPSPLVKQTIEVNTNLSVYLTSGNMQIGQLVIEHPKEQGIPSITTGLRVAMDLPQMGAEKGQTKAYYVSPSPNLEGHKNSIMFYMALILDENGISSSKIGTVEGETFTSGFDRLIASADVQDIIEDNQTIYRKVENKVYGIVKAIHKADGDVSFTSDKVNITYLLPEIMLSDSDKLDNLDKKKALGLWHKWELIKEANPNLTEEQAKAKAKELEDANIENRSNNINNSVNTELD